MLREFGKPVEIETLHVDDPGPGEVLVRTAACGVCHSDLHFKQGSMPISPCPSIMGHEAAGIVEAVGSGVTSLVPGDHVIACNSVGCGQCPQCMLGRRHLCRDRSWLRRPKGNGPRFSKGEEKIAPFTDLGGFSEYMLLPEASVLRIEKDIPLEHAALLGCAIITGVGAALNTARIKPGSTVAVFGCGGIGSSIVQGARIAGAEKIIAIDLVASKREQALRFGATDAIDPTAGDAVEAIRELTGGGADYAFDAVGSVELMRQSIAALTVRGTAVLVGAPPRRERLELSLGELMSEKRITGSLMGSSRFKLDAPYYLELYRQGRLDLEGLVSHRVPLDRLEDAFTAMERGEAMRSVVIF
ncbi:Zn-dependent alcohol dehydrogenase [Sphingopyxis sp.]|uniref:Zn-dependent alcohol dehydrogenase n=1 Tax=Sphingopyxis sp. TaxID=1908224 RepID=UPI002E164E4D